MITSKMTMKGDKDYTIIGKNNTEVIVQGRNAKEALGIFLKRGRHGLGRTWTLTRQRNGWIVASPSENRTLERTYHKLRETEWDNSIRKIL
jgi:hypothetical protein